MIPRTIEWIGNLEGCVQLVDQTLLPERLELLRINDVKTLFEAIRCLKVRGAPAIGIAGAMGLVLALRSVRSGQLALFVTTVDVLGQQLGRGPSILEPDNLMTRLSGTSSGATASRY